MSSRTLFVLSLPVVYLLSVPPILSMAAHQDKVPKEWIDQYAVPYFWMYDNTPMRKPLEAYFNWCWEHMKSDSTSTF